jgi:hypothetical protein
MNVFHDHLDVCERCANNPFDLCPLGARLLAESATSFDPTKFTSLGHHHPHACECVECEANAKGAGKRP